VHENQRRAGEMLATDPPWLTPRQRRFLEKLVAENPARRKACRDLQELNGIADFVRSGRMKARTWA
jgi:hypothetical protein